MEGRTIHLEEGEETIHLVERGRWETICLVGRGGETIHLAEKGGETIHPVGRGGETIHPVGRGGETIHQEERGGETIHPVERGGETIHREERGEETIRLVAEAEALHHRNNLVVLGVERSPSRCESIVLKWGEE